MPTTTMACLDFQELKQAYFFAKQWKTITQRWNSLLASSISTSHVSFTFVCEILFNHLARRQRNSFIQIAIGTERINVSLTVLFVHLCFYYYSGASRISKLGAWDGAPTCYLTNFPQNIAWKWRNFVQRSGVCIPRQPVYTPSKAKRKLISQHILKRSNLQLVWNQASKHRSLMSINMAFALVKWGSTFKVLLQYRRLFFERHLR